MAKDKRVEKEFQRISSFFEELPENEKDFLIPMLQNAAFMHVTLNDLQEDIRSGGTVDLYQNGENQHGLKASASLQAYNSVLKNFTSVMKQLYQLLPPEKKETNSYLDLIKGKGKTLEEIKEERSQAEEDFMAFKEQLHKDRDFQQTKEFKKLCEENQSKLREETNEQIRKYYEKR